MKDFFFLNGVPGRESYILSPLSDIAPQKLRQKIRVGNVCLEESFGTTLNMGYVLCIGEYFIIEMVTSEMFIVFSCKHVFFFIS